MTRIATRWITVRLTQHQFNKVMLMSCATSKPGNITAGIRYAIREAPFDNAELYDNQDKILLDEERDEE